MDYLDFAIINPAYIDDTLITDNAETSDPYRQPGEVPFGGGLASISPTFDPSASLFRDPPDVLIISGDNVGFFVHFNVLRLPEQSTLFRVPLAQDEQPPSAANPMLLPLVELSPVVLLMLLALYDLSWQSQTTQVVAFDEIVAAIDALRSYGYPVPRYLSPSSPLYQLLLGQAPLRPIEAYTVAAENNVGTLASAVSSHLLSYHLASCPDTLAMRIGGLYFKRLHALQDGRVAELRRMVLSPPYPHAPTRACDFPSQKLLNRAWAMAAAQVCWDSRPDLSAASLRRMLCSLETHLECEDCKTQLTKHVDDIVVKWSLLDRNI